MCGRGSACECVGVGVRVSVWVEMCNGGCKVCGTQEGSGITHCHQI